MSFNTYLKQENIPAAFDKEKAIKELLVIMGFTDWSDPDSHWRAYIIAQHDDEDYSESGYCLIANKEKTVFGLFSYSHCSCYDTKSSFNNNKQTFTWVGPREEFKYLAENKLDPSMAGRTANEEDYDYDHLIEVYKQFLDWDKNN